MDGIVTDGRADRRRRARQPRRSPSPARTSRCCWTARRRTSSTRPRTITSRCWPSWRRTRARGSSRWSIPPQVMDPPLPTERVPTQHNTDLRAPRLAGAAARSRRLRHPRTASPGTSTFYWGPPVRVGLPQPALSVDLGPQTNVLTRPDFRIDALSPVMVAGRGPGPADGRPSPPWRPTASLRPPLAALPLWATSRHLRTRRAAGERDGDGERLRPRTGRGGPARIDAVVGEGELDGGRYGAVLRPRGLVGVRGAGWSARRPLVRPPGRPRPGARRYTADVHHRPGGLRRRRSRWWSYDRPVLRQVPRHGRQQHRPDGCGAGSRCRCPAVLGDGPPELGRGRACPTRATRSASSPYRRSARTCGSSSRAATRITRSSRAASGGRARRPATGLPTTKVLKTDGVTLTLEDLPGGGGLTIEVGSPAVGVPMKVACTADGIELSIGASKIAAERHLGVDQRRCAGGDVMSAPLVQQGATVICAHGGQAQPTAPNPRVNAFRAGRRVPPAPWTVAGCTAAAERRRPVRDGAPGRPAPSG